LNLFFVIGKACNRPKTVFFLKLRGTGGKMLGEGVLNHVFERDQMAIVEGWSLRHGQTAAKLRYFEDQGGVVRITILRDPIARAISRYWFVVTRIFLFVRCSAS
jgi:hypothetical protein